MMLVCDKKNQLIQDVITDLDIQALLDCPDDLPHGEYDRIMNLIRRNPVLRQRFEDLKRQKDLLRQWWEDTRREVLQ